MPSDEAKTEAILKAALELFVERGFHGTPVPLIAERAGVGAGTIYRSFESKEALVNALYQRWKQAIVDEMVRGFPADAPPREQFRTIWERMASFAMKHPRELSFLELHHHGSYLDKNSLAIEHGITEFGVMMVRRAQELEGIKRGDPMLLIEFANGAFLGVFRAAMEGRVKLSKEMFLFAEQCCWEALRA
ncbi:MAG TPA: TetR/AcrR family transcriptional regulator [Polyangia bacterium]|jgi:AcrR family transcriptional regulator|nr:TetR/AcrR family transcriptional regulator [Polyangia bacterium]